MILEVLWPKVLWKRFFGIRSFCQSSYYSFWNLLKDHCALNFSKVHHLGATFMTVFLFTLICERGTPMNSGNRLLPFLHTYWIGQLMQFPTTIFCKWRVLYYLPLKLRALWKIFFHPEKYKKKFQTDLVTLSTYLIYPTSRIPNLYWIQKPFACCQICKPKPQLFFDDPNDVWISVLLLIFLSSFPGYNIFEWII